MEQFPDIGLDEIKKELETNGLSVRLQSREPEMFAAMEWIIPTGAIIYLTKSYFDGFLKEAGKDHYNLLKTSFKKIATNARAVPVKLFSSGGEKINKNYTQSHSISLVLKTKNNRTLKLLFDDNLSKEDWDNAIDQLLEYTIQNYETAPNDSLSVTMSKLKQGEAFWIYAIIDPGTKQLIFHDDMTLITLERNNQVE